MTGIHWTSDEITILKDKYKTHSISEIHDMLPNRTIEALDWIYKDSSNELRLERKYLRYLQVCEYYR